MPPTCTSGRRIAFVRAMAIILIAVWGLMTPQTAQGQRNEIGLTFGGSFYMGDLNPKLPMVMVNPAGGMLYRLNFSNHISVRANVLYMRVEGNDRRLATYNPARDLSFFSDIYEFSLQAEVNFLSYLPGDLKTPFTPYVFAGTGAFLFHPKRQEANGQIIDLHNIEQNPNREVESLTSHNFLFGLGFKFNITRFVSTGMEWGMRRTGTDYLDDVSIRGNPKTNDWYSYFGLIMTFRINDPTGARCPYPD